MSESRKPQGAVRVYYQFPPKGKETSLNQITLEQVKKYFSKKPLRRGAQPQDETDAGRNARKTDPRPNVNKPDEEDRPSE